MGVLEQMITAAAAPARQRRGLSRQGRAARTKRDALLEAWGIKERDVRQLPPSVVARLHNEQAFSSDPPPDNPAAPSRWLPTAAPATGPAQVEPGGLADALTAPQVSAPSIHDRRRGPNLSPAELSMLFTAAAQGARRNPPPVSSRGRGPLGHG